MATSNSTAATAVVRMAILRILVFLGLVAASLFFIRDSILASLQSNLTLNLIILGTFGIGVCFSLFNLIKLSREIHWLKESTRNRESLSAPNWFAPLTEFSQQPPQNPSPTDLQIVFHKVESRLIEAREVPKYLIGLLVFLGLLGTFWGLSQTIKAVSGVISSLSTEGAESVVSFEMLREGLRNPLSGMGTAFSCSMFGLAGSLILGFVELQVGRAFAQAQMSVEEWLSRFLSKKTPEKTIPLSNDPDYLIKVLGFMSENLEVLSTAEARRYERSHQLEKALMLLTDKTTTLIESNKLQQVALSRLTEQQLIMQKWIQQSEGTGTEDHLKPLFRNIESFLSKSSQDHAEQSQKLVEELRKELRLLGKLLYRDSDASTQRLNPSGSSKTIKAI